MEFRKNFRQQKKTRNKNIRQEPCRWRESAVARLFLFAVIVQQVERLPSVRRATRTLPDGRRTCTFLSTPSARRATLARAVEREEEAISIHALREEGDPPKAGLQAPHGNFYPRPPRGGRRTLSRNPSLKETFLSTPSARRATLSRLRRQTWPAISIHALREEGDCCPAFGASNRTDFYPRPPRGGRLCQSLFDYCFL